MSTTITIELCKEDRSRLDKILEALQACRLDKILDKILEELQASRPNRENCCKTCASMIDHAWKYGAASGQEPQEAPEPEAPKTTPQEPEKPTAPEPAPEAPTVTHAEIQQKVIRLSAAGKKAEAREIVTAYAGKISDIPEDKLQEVADKLAALA